MKQPLETMTGNAAKDAADAVRFYMEALGYKAVVTETDRINRFHVDVTISDHPKKPVLTFEVAIFNKFIKERQPA